MSIINFTEFLLSESQIDQVGQKIDELVRALYALNCSRERRIDGYTNFQDSSRKFRFKKTIDKDNFYIEFVNKSDESYVAEIGDCMNKSIDELVEIIKEY